MRQMTMLIAWLMVTLVACQSLPGPSREHAEKQALTHELMRLSGLEQQIRSIPQLVHAGFAERKDTLPLDYADALTPALEDAFNVQRLNSQIAQHLAQALDLATMRKALDWLQSGLGRKVTGLEEAAATPQGVQHMQAFSQQLQESPPAGPRLGLVQRLDEASQSTEMAVTLAEAMAMGMATALDAIQPPELQIGVDKLRQQLAQQRSRMRPQYQQMTLNSLLYTYQPLSDDELARYLEFLESPAGKVYQRVLNTAMKKTLTVAGERLGKNLADVVKQLRRKQGAAQTAPLVRARVPC